jgi:Subtilase family
MPHIKDFRLRSFKKSTSSLGKSLISLTQGLPWTSKFVIVLLAVLIIFGPIQIGVQAQNQVSDLLLEKKSNVDTLVNKMVKDSGARLGSGMIVKFKSNNPSTQSLFRARIGIQSGKDEASLDRSISTLSDQSQVFEFESDNDLKLALRTALLSGGVEYAQPVYKYTTFADYSPTSNPQFNARQWYLQNSAPGIRMPSAWGFMGDKKGVTCSNSGAGRVCQGEPAVKIAVIDTGVNLGLPDMSNANFDITRSARFFYNADGSCPPGQFYESINFGTNSSPNIIKFCRALGGQSDDLGHGTQVASVLAMDDNTAGGIGVADNLSILPIALNGTFSFNSFLLADSIDYAVSSGARVINLSLGGVGEDFYLGNAINRATANGAIVVTAAGNCGNKTALQCGVGDDNVQLNPVIYPAAYPNVISVGAVNYSSNLELVTRSNYSSCGNFVTLVTPVGDGTNSPSGIYGLNRDGTENTNLQGTSFSTPIVSAAVGLMLSLDNRLNYTSVKSILTSTARTLGRGNYDPQCGSAKGQFGAGLLDVQKALQMTWESYNWVKQANSVASPVSHTEFNGLMYALQRGNDNNLYQRSSEDGLNWSDWQQQGGEQTNDEPALSAALGRLWQGRRGTDNGIYIRSSEDNVSWSAWTRLPGSTSSGISITEFDNRAFLVVRGGDNRLYYTMTSDGNNWSLWQTIPGLTPDAPRVTFAFGRLWLMHRGFDNNMYLSSSTDGNNWTPWLNQTGLTASSPDIIGFGGNLYILHRGLNNMMYYKTSPDGLLWSAWQQLEGQTQDAPRMSNALGTLWFMHRGTDSGYYLRHITVGASSRDTRNYTISNPSGADFNGVYHQSIRGTDSGIYFRSTTNWPNWTFWLKQDGTVPDSPAITGAFGKLWNAVRGLDGRIYIRNSVDGNNWGSWTNLNIISGAAPTLASYGGKLYLMYKDINTGQLIVTTSDGLAWSAPQPQQGSTPDVPLVTTGLGRIWQAHRGMNNSMYTRFSTDGVNWSSWQDQNGQTYSRPALSGTGGNMVMAHQGQDNFIYAKTSTDGINWSQWSRTPYTTIDAPNLTTAQGKIWLEFRGLNNQVYTIAIA